jgi:hypothetical protein
VAAALQVTLGASRLTVGAPFDSLRSLRAAGLGAFGALQESRPFGRDWCRQLNVQAPAERPVLLQARRSRAHLQLARSASAPASEPKASESYPSLSCEI